MSAQFNVECSNRKDGQCSEAIHNMNGDTNERFHCECSEVRMSVYGKSSKLRLYLPGLKNSDLLISTTEIV
jgi:hypothetical protein